MKLKNSKCTLLIGAESTTIELIDSDSSTTFARVILTPKQLSQCLSRMAYVDCEIELLGIENVGKTMELKKHEFEIPKNIPYSERKNVLAELIKETLPDGWVSDNYFSSQDTFFTKDGKDMARTTIRRWV